MQRNRIISIKIEESDPTEPVLLADVKTRLRIDGTDYDTELTGLIKSCRQEVERTAHISIVPKTITLVADIYCQFRLPYGPVTGITSAKVSVGVETDGTTEYEDLTEDEFSTNEFNELTSTYSGNHVIVYTAETQEVSEDLKARIMSVIAIRYEHRSDALNEAKINDAIFEIVKPYWIPWL